MDERVLKKPVRTVCSALVNNPRVVPVSLNVHHPQIFTQLILTPKYLNRNGLVTGAKTNKEPLRLEEKFPYPLERNAKTIKTNEQREPTGGKETTTFRISALLTPTRQCLFRRRRKYGGGERVIGLRIQHIIYIISFGRIMESPAPVTRRSRCYQKFDSRISHLCRTRLNSCYRNNNRRWSQVIHSL